MNNLFRHVVVHLLSGERKASGVFVFAVAGFCADMFSQNLFWLIQEFAVSVLLLVDSMDLIGSDGRTSGLSEGLMLTGLGLASAISFILMHAYSIIRYMYLT